MSDTFDNLSDDWLSNLAGKAVFERGLRYHDEGRVLLSQCSATSLTGEVRGSQTYCVSLKSLAGGWQWQCNCPAAEDRSFCKHLVAAAIAARSGDSGDERTPSSAKKAAGDDLMDYLRSQPAERLAGWLKTLADEDRDVEKLLLLHRASDQPGALKGAIAKMLNAGGFLDYRRSMAYARRLDAVIEQLESLLPRDPQEGRLLCEYALGRLFKIIGTADDSAGTIGDRIARLAELHGECCAAAPPGKALARPLHALQRKDEWGVVVLSRYWTALGSRGQTEYGKLVCEEFHALPPPSSQSDRYGESGAACRHAEAFARCSGDFELLQRVLRRDLSYAHDHLRVLESLIEFHREREALAWAEAAVKRFPDDARLRTALSTCLSKSGLQEDAIDQLWMVYAQRPDAAAWHALKRASGTEWPTWRQRALDEAARRENGDVTLRVLLLRDDGDLTAALELARAHPVWPDVLLSLAGRITSTDPATAGAFCLRVARKHMERLEYPQYRRFVDLLARIAKLLPEADWKPLLTEVRHQHGRKTKLMELLAKTQL